MAGAVPGIELTDVGRTFIGQAGWRGPASHTEALRGITLRVADGSFVSLIGPSGCGKSTLLRIVAGLIEPDAGDVAVLGHSPEEACAGKQIGLVPQSPALLPWRTVLDNVRLPLQVNRTGGRRTNAGGRADPVLDPRDLLAAVGLGGVLDRRPAELSGGMQQRVAIARAFVFGAPVLLMDEPFSALDELTRETLRRQLLDLWQAHRKTVLFVTHSVTEAVTLSDRVVVLSPAPGRVSADIAISLPRPRSEGIDLTEAFRQAERAVRSALRGPSPGAA